MANWFQKAWNNVTSTVSKVTNTIGSAAQKIVTPILDNAGGVIATIAGYATGNTTLINAGVNSIADGLISGGKKDSTSSGSVSTEDVVKAVATKIDSSTLNKYVSFTDLLR